MKRVLFVTNYPSPYRVRFYDELGKTCDVTVLFFDPLEDMTHRDRSWFEEGQGGFRGVQLKRFMAVKEESLCMDVIPWLRREYDEIIVSGYSSPTVILAMLYMRLRRIPFYMEVDGGLIRQDSRLKYWVKKRLVTLARRWISSGASITRYLVHYGAREENVYFYPFSSLEEKSILNAPVSREEKQILRGELGVEEGRMILSIGQFIHRKGFDVLLHAAQSLPKDVGIYIVGGEATEEYLKLRSELGLTNVHFLGFQKKQRLAQLYRAADLFVLPTREDIWGLVINEAMAYGLPVVTTDRCAAGLELVEEGVNGGIVPTEDDKALAEAIRRVLDADLDAMGAASLEKIRPYTIENMARAHETIFAR